MMNTFRLLSNRIFWLAGIFPLLLLGIVYAPSIRYLVHLWLNDENFSHGFFIPLISLFLIWQKRHILLNMEIKGSWWGLPVVLAGCTLYLAGELATLYILLHLSLIVVLIGLLLSAIGWRGLRVIAFPVAFLFTMIRPPDFLLQSLSAELQLISSKLAVGFDQLMGVTVYREGNVIDFGAIQLQVAEACSGLRYLFPLSTMALMMAYLFQGKIWKKIFIFLSSIPLSILLNGFRIGMTGILVDHLGEGMAEGFFHAFSGWFLFVTALLILFLEFALLGGIFNRHNKRSFSDLIHIQSDENQGIARERNFSIHEKKWPAPYLISLVLLVPLVGLSFLMVSRQESIPDRHSFYDFPMTLSGWKGTSEKMEAVYVETLKFDDYILANYRTENGDPVNFYSAWYNSQKKGQSAHSPRTCIPGGGWEITSLTEKQLLGSGNLHFKVNRAIIQKGDQKQVVYYWFQQRGRVLTNEYLVKYYLLRDALVRNRTDGALIRLTSTVFPGEDETIAEHRMALFTENIQPLLKQYIPD